MITSKQEFQARVGRVLVSQEELQGRIAEVGQQLSDEYEGKPLLLISILNGAFVFMADFCRALTVPCEVAFMCAKSYAGTESLGTVNITMDVTQDLSRYHVVIVEDIVDTGRTLALLTEKLRERRPLSLRVVTLLDKPSRRVVDFQPDIALFTIPDVFTIGYGLDCDAYFRNLPYIAEYKQD